MLSRIAAGAGLAPPEISLLPCGKAAEEQLLKLPERYPGLFIDNYVIMPNHIHILMRMETAGGASPAPTVSDIVCAFKSLTARKCGKVMPAERLFQRSFHDHIIRDENDYLTKWHYIDENPAKWGEDPLYIAE